MATKKSSKRKSFRKTTITEIQVYLNRRPDEIISIHQILKDFEIGHIGRKQVKEILQQLVQDKKLVRLKGNRFRSPSPESFVLGRMSLHRDGFGFVIPDKAVSNVVGDIFIPPRLTGSAMDGDRVEVKIILRKRDGRAEGKVTSIIKRAHETIVGQLLFDGVEFFVSPDEENLPHRILVTNADSKDKDKLVEVKLTQFPFKNEWPTGKIVSVLGSIEDPSVATKAVIRKYGLRLDFPEAVLEEIKELPEKITKINMYDREDFRQKTIITIDPETARDYDDGVGVEELSDGSFLLGVHIADVSHFVEMNSALDREAYFRGTSVYFPDQVVPMLPEKLSSQLCSLKPKVNRLTLSVLISIDHKGNILSHSLHNSVIRSAKRMSYKQVQQILDDDEETKSRFAALVAPIESMQKLALLLMKQRRKRGTIDLDLPEPELIFDASGCVSNIVKAERKASHRIIEEFMIAANEVVAQFLSKEGVESIFRVHETPHPHKVEEFSELVAQFGLKFKPRSLRPIEFQKFIHSISGRSDEEMLAYLMLRSFKQAKYLAVNSGHFGLASKYYTHFTSPIRRYPDLVVHRILKACIKQRSMSNYTNVQLESIASTSSEKERRATAAERELYDWKRMEFLRSRVGDTFHALIISVWRDGIRIELLGHFVEGFIAIDEMSEDHYTFQPRNRFLIGRKTHRRFKIGQQILVRLIRIDSLLKRAYFLPMLANRQRTPVK